jgi:branched-chain amino acid transport system permease protein
MEIFIQTVVSGILIGLVFSLIAVGLTLIFGVVEIVNFAHGEFLMLAMYSTFWMFNLFHIDPIFCIPINALLLFFFGVAIYYLLIKHVIKAPMVAQIFATFGLMIFLQNVALFFFKPDYRMIGDTFLTGRIEIGGIFIGIPQLASGLMAAITTVGLYMLVKKTDTGMALQAVSEDKVAATLMGINSDRTFALAWGIGSACVGVAGTLVSTFYYIFPEVGLNFCLTAFVVVALGGFGSIPGAFIAGIIIGLVEVVGGFLIMPAYKHALVFAVYLVIVFTRPKGLMGQF